MHPQCCCRKPKGKGRFKHEGQSLEGRASNHAIVLLRELVAFIIPFPLWINDYTLRQNLSFLFHFCTFNAASKSGAKKESVKAGIKVATRQKVDITGD